MRQGRLAQPAAEDEVVQGEVEPLEIGRPDRVARVAEVPAAEDLRPRVVAALVEQRPDQGHEPLGLRRPQVDLEPRHVVDRERTLRRLEDPANPLGAIGDGRQRDRGEGPPGVQVVVGGDDQARLRVVRPGEVVEVGVALPVIGRVPPGQGDDAGGPLAAEGHPPGHLHPDRPSAVGDDEDPGRVAQPREDLATLVGRRRGQDAHDRADRLGGRAEAARPPGRQPEAGLGGVAVERPVLLGLEEPGRDGGLPLPLDGRLADPERPPVVAPAVTAVVALLDPRIDAIHVRIGDAPGHVRVPADREPGRARHRGPHRIAGLTPVVPVEDRLVPDGGDAVDLQVRVVAEDRRARGRPRPGDDPGVRPRGPGQARHRPERLGHHRGVERQPPEQPRVEPAEPPREQLLQGDLGDPRADHLDEPALHLPLGRPERDVADHLGRQHHVGERPGVEPAVIAERPQLPRQPGRGEIPVDPRAVGVDRRPDRAGQGVGLGLGVGEEVEPAEVAIDGEHRVGRVEPAAPLPPAEDPDEEHLEPSVAGVAVAEPAERLVARGGPDRRHAVLRPRERDRAGGAGQGAIGSAHGGSSGVRPGGGPASGWDAVPARPVGSGPRRPDNLKPASLPPPGVRGGRPGPPFGTGRGHPHDEDGPGPERRPLSYVPFATQKLQRQRTIASNET